MIMEAPVSSAGPRGRSGTGVATPTEVSGDAAGV